MARPRGRADQHRGCSRASHPDPKATFSGNALRSQPRRSRRSPASPTRPNQGRRLAPAGVPGGDRDAAVRRAGIPLHPCWRRPTTGAIRSRPTATATAARRDGGRFGQTGAAAKPVPARPSRRRTHCRLPLRSGRPTAPGPASTIDHREGHMKPGSDASPARRRGAAPPPGRACPGMVSWRGRAPSRVAPAPITIPGDRDRAVGLHGHLAAAIATCDRTPCGNVGASLASVVTGDAVRLARSAGATAFVARAHATRAIPPRLPGRAGPPSASLGRGSRP
ncbi:hypothetical protein SAMN05192568_10044 [Methylobacterium pseudosasicola]|uniref:Uncharacterized protein n=1 Tax=Methylobacterium pseudosasicola TaxID=582667 RepID=A0A1I4H3B1_9HYPH|nr:hypothetical protein SAMN05192568_10044 [Methylobacterium pseudosasicola]